MMRHDSAQQRAVTFGIDGAATIAICTIAALGGTAHAQWSSTFATPGPNYHVNAFTLHDDGSGEALYVAGGFDFIDGQPLNHIAKYSGGTWHALGQAVPDDMTILESVDCLASYNGELIAAGRFVLAGGQAVSNIARWNGSTWQALAEGINGTVRELVVYNGELIAGGDFTMAGTSQAFDIARWNGAIWQPLGSGMSPGGNGVSALIVYQGDLIAGGNFASAGGAASSANLARWDGNNWHGMGAFTSTADGTVYAMTLHDGALVIGGLFAMVAGAPTPSVAKWDGNAWHGQGNGMSDAVLALASHGGLLFAGGPFTTAGGAPATALAKWNGASWTAVESGVRAPIGLASVRALMALPAGLGGQLVIGGSFDSHEIPASNLVQRNSAGQWSRLSECPTCMGLSGPVGASIVHDDGSGEALYVGGSFLRAGNIDAMRIARWDGTAWSTVGDGFDGPSIAPMVTVLARFDDGSGGGTQLYAAGSFTTSGTTPVFAIARWDGKQWHALPGGNIAGGATYCMTVFDDGTGPALYVGGSFTSIGGQPMNRLAKWDGANWTDVGGGVSAANGAHVRCLAVYDDGTGPGLAVGGLFTHAGPVAARALALWRNNTWSSIGGSVGTNGGTVAALAPWPNATGSQLIAQGWFGVIGGVAAGHIARWDGAAWHDLAPSPPLLPAAVPGADMLVASAANGCKELFAQFWQPVFPNGLYVTARWNGWKWQPLGSPSYTEGPQWVISLPGPVNMTIASLSQFEGDMYFTGGFGHAGGLPGANMAVWNIDASFACLGDIDGDDSVNINDLLAVINHWGPCADCPADSSPCGGDGQVNINDLLEVINQWGPCK